MENKMDMNLIKDVVFYIIEDMDELLQEKDKDENAWWQLMGLAKALGAIKLSYSEYIQELGLDFDVDKKYL